MYWLMVHNNSIGYWSRIWQRFSVEYNRLKFRFHGVRFGRKCRPTGRIYLELKDGAEITLGDSVVIVGGMGINQLGRNLCSGIFAESGARITVGDNSGISCSSVWSRKEITIGSNVNIGADCIIMDHDAHSLNYMDRRHWKADSEGTLCAAVTIGDNAFIGAGSMILKGVCIGPRSIVGAGSVVTCNIPPDEIWAGNPAKFIHRLEK